MMHRACALLLVIVASGCHPQVVDEPQPAPGQPSEPSPVVEPPDSEPSPAEPSAGAVGATCGTRGAAPCAEGLFCQHPMSASCGEADHPGTCQRPPEMCTREHRPVCGCDGQTYGNACTAAAAGVSVRSEGACPSDQSASACVPSGCGVRCVEEHEARSMLCAARPEADCYARARCERQPDGECGWTMTDDLRACLDEHGSSLDRLIQG